MDSKALSILIADDHPLFRSALQQVVGQLYPQAELHEAANVAELQQQVELHRGINLLLLDLHMPGALGYSALSWFAPANIRRTASAALARFEPNITAAETRTVAEIITSSPTTKRW